MKRLIALAAPFALVLAACGGDDGGSAGGSTENWCALATQLDESGDDLDGVDFFDPEAIRDVYAEFSSTVDEARDAAPAEIRDDVDTLASGVERVEEELAAVDYNFLDLDLAFMDDLEDEMDAATDRIDAFNERECGIASSSSPTDADDDADVDVDVDVDEDADADSDGDVDIDVDVDADDGEFDLGAGSVRDQLVAQFVASGFTETEASCIADNLDFAVLSDADGDPSAILEVFDTCNISLERLAEFGGG